MTTLAVEPVSPPIESKKTAKRRFQKLTAILDGYRSVCTMGVDSTMDAFVKAITELLKRAIAAQKQGVELPTFLAILRDQSRR